MKVQAEVIERAKKITLLLMDCDGVLTDGKLYFTENGEEMKVFHVRDGQGLAMWHAAGFRSGIITGRKSKSLERRANELSVNFLKQNSRNKLNCFQEIISEVKVSIDEVAFVGDDVQDIILLEKVGLPIAVADAHSEIFPYILHKTIAKGGSGAIREVIDLLLKSKQSHN
ncbi:3-deoxy-manno-octulosonate-8-phosphatase KdsC [soil metagenome]